MKKLINLYKKNKEIVNYIVVGALTTIVSLGSFYLLRIFIFTTNNQFDIQICNVISWILAVTFAFLANKKYVFNSKEKGFSAFKELIKFFLSRISTLLIEMFVMFILTSPININDKIAKIIAQFIVLVLNYVFSKIFVFKKHN